MKNTILIMLLTVLTGCSTAKTTTDMSNISEQTVQTVLARLGETSQDALAPPAERGVRQAAALWREPDGSQDDFIEFCLENYCVSEQSRKFFLINCRLLLKIFSEQQTN